MKYSPAELREKAVVTLNAIAESDLRAELLVYRLAHKTGYPVHVVIDMLKKLAE